MKTTCTALTPLMKHSILSIFLVLSGILPAAPSASPQNPKTAAAKMTKIVLRNTTPGLDKDSYDAQPVTVYLYGENFIRVEEQPDTLVGLHGLMIIRNSESWSINLLDNTATHYVTDKDLYDMSIPLIPQTAHDKRFEGLVYGRELIFFTSAAVSKETLNGMPVKRYSMLKDGIQFELVCKTEPLKPYLLKISAAGQPMYQYSFDEYIDDLPVDMKLFEVPSNVKIMRLGPHPSDMSQKDPMVGDLKENFDFMTFYYQNPQPRKAGRVLKNIINSSFFAETVPYDSTNWDSTAYFFSRIARTEPALVDDYLDIFKNGNYEQRCYVLKILQVCGNPKVISFLETGLKQNTFGKEKERIEYALQKGIPIRIDPLTRPVKEAGDLDFLWMEFMATGSEDAVTKVVEVLKDCDSNNQGKYILANTALWSLNSFCRQHEKVMNLCKKTIQKTNGISREKLEELINEIEIEKMPQQLPKSKMLKVVLRETLPDAVQGSFGPKTFYRLGSKLWRVEKNTSEDSPMTIIVKEPDVWIIMSAQGEGIHFTGPGEYNYFFPTVMPADGEVNLHGLQLGTELAFMKAKKARCKPAGNEKDAYSQYVLDIKQVRVELLCKSQAQKEVPYKLTISENATLLFECTYDEYNPDLPSDAKLFEIPKNIKISEESWNEVNPN